jgi:hypothetical protein
VQSNVLEYKMWNCALNRIINVHRSLKNGPKSTSRSKRSRHLCWQVDSVYHFTSHPQLKQFSKHMKEQMNKMPYGQCSLFLVAVQLYLSQHFHFVPPAEQYRLIHLRLTTPKEVSNRSVAVRAEGQIQRQQQSL